MTKMGRPESYTEKKATQFCSEIAQGRSLRSVCEDEGMPTPQTVYNWFIKHPDFLEQYARAKDDSADYDADRIQAIAEDVLAGKVDPQAARVAIDALKWTAGKKKAKKYGDFRQVEHSGHVTYEDMSDEELESELRQLKQAEEDALRH